MNGFIRFGKGADFGVAQVAEYYALIKFPRKACTILSGIQGPKMLHLMHYSPETGVKYRLRTTVWELKPRRDWQRGLMATDW